MVVGIQQGLIRPGWHQGFAWPANHGLGRGLMWLSLPLLGHTGDTLYDLSGIASDGVFQTAPTWEVGPLGYQLDGVANVHVDAPLRARMKVSRPYSIVAGLTFVTSSNTVVFEANGNNGWSLQTENSPRLKIRTAGGELNVASTLVRDGAPHLSVFSFGITNSDDVVYVDGVDDTDAQPVSTADPDYGAETRLDIMSRNGSVAYPGTIWLLAIFNRALSQQEAALWSNDVLAIVRFRRPVVGIAAVAAGITVPEMMAAMDTTPYSRAAFQPQPMLPF